ncbi:MAG TPA: hypothetical protein VN181_12960, partial [Thermoanaerobaculia bacterium]|nr:hypothetical protein [Thermoanaerobaculia bacterium]
RRQQVADLRAECRESFLAFKTEWNQFANELNSALASTPYVNNFNISTVSYDPGGDDAQTIINQINSVLKNANSQIEELRTALSKDVTGFTQLEVDLANGTATVQQVTDIILLIGESFLSGFAAYYAYNGIRLFILLLNTADAGISSLAEIIGGVLGGMIFGAVAVIITDAIISAIEGAIERKQLEDAIAALQQFKTKVTDPLSITASDVGAQYTALSQGLYRLNDNLLLVKVNGNWQVISTGKDDTHHAVVNMTAGAVQHFGSPKAA